MTKCAQFLEPNKELEFFTSDIFLVIVTEEAENFSKGSFIVSSFILLS